MRCPYCGGLNADQARFCARCGRDIAQRPASTQSSPPSRPPYSPPQRPSYPPPLPPRSSQPVQTSGRQPPYGPPRAPQPVAANQEPVASRSRSATSAQSQAGSPAEQRKREGTQNGSPGVAAPVIEPPAAFPPRTAQQLRELEDAALMYTVLDESESYGRKKIVRIGYPSCTGWQQVATLYKASKAYRSAQFDTIIIYGVSPEKFDKYQYTNGMLQLDQKVRLGSQVLNRYQIETENGFSSDAVRIVLTEE